MDVAKAAYHQEVMHEEEEEEKNGGKKGDKTKDGGSSDDDDDGDDEINCRDVGHNIYILAQQVLIVFEGSMQSCSALLNTNVSHHVLH